eukprot:6244867-Amphidinium_carterae.1
MVLTHAARDDLPAVVASLRCSEFLGVPGAEAVKVLNVIGENNQVNIMVTNALQDQEVSEFFATPVMKPFEDLR